MSFPGCAVIERASDWLVVVGDQVERVDSNVSAKELAVCLGLMLKLSALQDPDCVLAPGSTSCFFSTMDVEDDIELRDRSALTYELEDHLPIDAESMVADFMIMPSDEMQRRVAAVAIEVDRWQRIAAELELAGVPVKAIVPAAVLATGAFSADADSNETTALLFVEEAQCEWITIHRDAIHSWKHLVVDTATLRRHQKLDSHHADRIVVYGAEDDQRSTIASSVEAADFAAESFESLVIEGAELVLGNRWGRWFDLRRDALGPSDPLRAIQTQLRWVGVAAAACLLALAVGSWWRSHQIEAEIDNVRAQQQAMFQQAFPESKVPAALLRRVRSEHTKVLGSRGKTSAVDIPQSAPKVLRRLLTALPDDVRFRITRLNIADGTVDFDLQVQRAVDAGKVATALSNGGFDVSPPGTNQVDDNTYQSLIRAVWIEQPENAVTPRNDVSFIDTNNPGVSG